MDEIVRARGARVLDVPVIQSERDTGLVLDVKRIAVSHERTPFAWLETTSGDLYRLPDNLFSWAFDMVALTLAGGGNRRVGIFPTPVEFGILDGRAYAEFVSVFDLPGSDSPS